MKILLVLTSHNVLGDTGKPTGFWLEEFTAPYYAFTDAGAEVTVTSPKGGHPPIDRRLLRWCKGAHDDAMKPYGPSIRSVGA
ncbi:putative intracellular protease/amidase [Paraburkholderia sp. GAS42]